MYTQELAAWAGPAEGYVTHLLLMLQVADRWQSSACIDVVSKALEQTDLAQLTFYTSECIYSQPAGLQSSILFAPILEIAKRRLLATHGDALAVARDSSLQYQLMRLPQAAMLALLLCTDSENSVLLMLMLLRWLKYQPDMVFAELVIPAQYKELVESVRCSRLTNSYVPVLMSALSLGQRWSPILAKLVQYRSLELARRNNNGDFVATLLPAGWYKPLRPPSPLCGTWPPARPRLQISLSKEYLLASLEMMGQPNTTGNPFPQSVSTSVYSHGFNWTLKLGPCTTPTHRSELSLTPVMTCTSALTSRAAPSFAACKVECVLHRVPPLAAITCTWRNGVLGGRPFIVPHLQASFPQRGDLLEPAKWEPFLVDGSVRLEAVICDIA